MKKDSADLLEELKTCSDFTRVYREHGDSIVSTTLSRQLSELLQRHGIKKADAIRRSERSEDYAFQIFSGLRVPER